MIRQAAAIALMLAAGCTSGGIDADLAKVDSFAKRNRIGSSPDVFLVKTSFAGQSRVALFYGYADDLAACGEVAESLGAKYPDASYRCEYGN